MRRIFGAVVVIGWVLAAMTPARADNLGCFNASQAVHIWAQFADANGEGISPTSPSAKVFSPTDTTAASFTPTLAEIDNSGSPGLARGTFTLGGSPVSGIWTVQYKGTVGGNELTLIDVFQVPCPSVAIRAGGIGPRAFETAGTISNISGAVLTVSSDVIAAANHRAWQERIQVYEAATGLHRASSCVIASTTAAGPADTVTTAENISARISTSDTFDLVPDPSCAGLRPATLGRSLLVAAGGHSGIDLNATAGTLDAPEIGADALTAAKFAPDVTTELQTGLATAAALAQVDTVVDSLLVIANKVDDTLEDDGGTFRYTINALEQGPSGGGASAAAIRIEMDTNSTRLAAIETDTQDIQAKIGTPVGVSLSADLAAVESQTDDIGVAGAGLTNIPGGGGGGGGLDMAELVPGSPDSGSVGQALRFILDRLDLNVSTRTSQQNFDTKIPSVLTFTGLYPNVHVKGLDAGAITPAVMGLPEATVITAALGCNSGVNTGSIFSVNLTETQANYWGKGLQLMTMTSGALEGQSSRITSYTWTGSAGCLTVTPALTSAPQIGDTLTIVNK